ncbi:MAG: hypothetical protein ACRDWX_08225, partial [Acidimicrobiia bacterium]
MRETLSGASGSSAVPRWSRCAPEAVHYRHADQLYQFRAEVLQAAYQARPERFVKGTPRPWPLP